MESILIVALQGKVKTKEVEFIDSKGKPLGEFDEIDLQNKIFYEDKTAKGLNTINPRTGLPTQTAQAFADKQILGKTRNRINNLYKAASTREAKTLLTNVPNLDELKNIKEFKFRLDGDTPDLRNAVENSMNQLRKEFPGYKFSAEYGGNR